MKQRLWLCLLAAATVAAWPRPASAQPPRLSHVPIPGGVVPSVADKYLEDRLQQAETADMLRHLFTELAKHPEKLNISPEDQQKLRDALKRVGPEPEKALADPEVSRILVQAAKQLPPEKMASTPEEQARVLEMVRGLVPEGEPSGLDPSRPGGAPASSIPPPGTGPQSGSPAQPPLTPPGSGGTAPISAPPSSSAPEPSSALKDSVGKMAKALAESPLGDSPALNRMVANLSRVKGPRGPEAFDWEKQVTRLETRFADVGSRLPKISWPSIDFAPSRAGRGGVRAVAPEDTGGGGSRIFLVVLGGLAAGLLAWGLLRRPGVGLLGGAPGGWRLGPWPVRPEAVSTRDDLVRAFEHLALLRLGLAARSRNHRAIAARLGEADDVRRAAAERLAGLYEQARYAPPDEAVPDADLAGARADLSLLAGAPAA